MFRYASYLLMIAKTENLITSGSLLNPLLLQTGQGYGHFVSHAVVEAGECFDDRFDPA